MKIHVIPANRLTPAQVAAWSRLQQADPALESPFFRPEFTQVVASVRDDAEVAVLEENGEPVGFFPYQRDSQNIGVPLGGRLSDFHGLVVRPDIVWNAVDVVRACGLRAWRFDHLLASQEPFRPHHWINDGSPYMDLSQGWQAYLAVQLNKHRKTFSNLERRRRRAEKEFGPIRLQYHCPDKRIFATLIDWKRAQYRRNKVMDALAADWRTNLLEQVVDRQEKAFSGAVSALYLGDNLVAIRLSVRSYGVSHGWFSVYNAEFSEWSPGLLLILELGESCGALGIRRMDLGKGGEAYKANFMSQSTLLAEGCVDLRPIPRILGRTWRRTRRWLKHSPLGKPLTKPASVYFRLHNWLASR